jgi:hypothetical protein
METKWSVREASHLSTMIDAIDAAFPGGFGRLASAFEAGVGLLLLRCSNARVLFYGVN